MVGTRDTRARDQLLCAPAQSSFPNLQFLPLKKSLSLRVTGIIMLENENKTMEEDIYIQDLRMCMMCKIPPAGETHTALHSRFFQLFWPVWQ